MRLPEDSGGQIYTMEGVVASLILLSVLFFVLQSNSIIVPQTERSLDMKLYERASDTLTCIDWNSNESWSPVEPLTKYVTKWNLTGIPSGKTTCPDMEQLDDDLRSMLPEHVRYNVDFTYYDPSSGDKVVRPVIVHGIPGDNSVVSTRLVTLNAGEVSDEWKGYYSDFPHVVEVKLTCWYL